jgi:NADPH:quinone reductase-like Zn-dependent oxidoreductase
MTDRTSSYTLAMPRTLRLTDSTAQSLIEENVPRPRPGPGEVLIRVIAAGVTPTELRWYPTTHTKTGQKRIRPVPGHEFSGVIAESNDAGDLQIGQEVYGLNDWFAEGAMAEYCITETSFIAEKPPRLSHVEAASVPIGALTAWQGLYDRAMVRQGERVLIHGGAGAVGVFAIQFARMRGAHVFATASAHNLDFVMQLGAEQAINYRADRFEESAGNMDIVFDTVGGETLERSWRILKPGGRMITVAAAGEATNDERVRSAFFIVEPNQKELIEIGHLLDLGEIRPVVDAVVPFEQAAAAYAGRVQERLGRGKIVVSVGN